LSKSGERRKGLTSHVAGSIKKKKQIDIMTTIHLVIQRGKINHSILMITRMHDNKNADYFQDTVQLSVREDKLLTTAHAACQLEEDRSSVQDLRRFSRRKAASHTVFSWTEAPQVDGITILIADCRVCAGDPFFPARLGCFFFQAEDGIRDWSVTGVQTCALPILKTPSISSVPRIRPLPGRLPAPARRKRQCDRGLQRSCARN